MLAALRLSLGLALLSLPLQAAGAGWSFLTPPGGKVTAVASSPVAPGVMLMGVSNLGFNQTGGVYRSADGGASWTKTNLAEPKVHSVFDIEFAPLGTSFAGTNNGLWKSTDAGLTWSAVPLGVPFAKVHEIEFVPGSPMEIWIGLELTNPPLMHSLDGGTTWQSVSMPSMPIFMQCRGIALSASAPTFIAAAFANDLDGSRIWVSGDGGATWGDKAGWLVSSNITDITTDGSKIWVTSDTLGFAAQSGLNYSADFGQTWHEVLDPSWPTPLLRDIHIDPAQPSTIYLGSISGGIYRSTDGGGTWTQGLAGTQGLSIETMASIPGTTGLLAGTSSFGLTQSPDGLSFGFTNGGLSLGVSTSLAANPLDAEEVALSYGLHQSDGGVLTSLDGGLTWAVESLPPGSFGLVRFSPTGILYASSIAQFSPFNEGLWRRSSSGWTNIDVAPSPFTANEIYELGFFESDPLKILAGGQSGLFSSEVTIWGTTDGGSTWNSLYLGASGSGRVESFLVLPDGTDQTVLATIGGPVTGPGELLRSLDGGTTWSVLSTNLPAGFRPRSLSASPADPSRVYLAGTGSGGQGGVAVSLDGGQTWGAIADTTDSVKVVVDPLRPERVFRATYSSTPDISEDGAATWSPLGAVTPNPSSSASILVQDLTFAAGPCGKLLFTASNGAWIEPEASCALTASATSISGSAGAALAFTIDMGPAHAGDTYWLLASGAGASPGLTLDGVLLPLNPDPIMTLTLTQPNSPVFTTTLGVLDVMGRGTATVNVPAGTILPPGVLHFASLTLQILPVAQVTGATAAVPIEWLP